MNDTNFRRGPQLGQLLEHDQPRDAVHVAVCPVEAGEMLEPGEPVQLREGKAVGADDGGAIGVVDPFLPVPRVEPGQRFWLLLFPGTVAGLRREWTHPDLPTEEVAASTRWLQELADNSRTDYEQILAGAIQGGITFRSETDGSRWAEDHRDEVEHHLDVVLKSKGLRATEGYLFFSCSC